MRRPLRRGKGRSKKGRKGGIADEGKGEKGIEKGGRVKGMGLAGLKGASFQVFVV